MSATTLPVIQPRTLLGFKTGIRGTATYVSDHEVLYPAAGVLTVHNFHQRRQQFIRLNDKENISILCLSPNRKYAAVGDVSDKPTISGYDLKALKRKKILTIPIETTAREFVSLEFTHDGKYLIAVLGEPDWLLLCFHWDKSKLESYGQANVINNPDSTIRQVACNPTDSSVVCLVGPSTFRLMSCSDNAWHQFGFQYADNYLLSCVTWITFDKVPTVLKTN